jgi:hypothetical protein
MKFEIWLIGGYFTQSKEGVSCRSFQSQPPSYLSLCASSYDVTSAPLAVDVECCMLLRQ